MLRTDERNYQILSKQEATYWGKTFKGMLDSGCPPDLQIKYRAEKPVALWDDSEVNTFVRGDFVSKIVNICCSKPGREVLELCCGAGALALEVARRGAHVTGIDISPEAIEIGKKYQAELGFEGSIDLIVGDLNTTKLPKDKYDVIFAWDGLHHIANIDHLISEVTGALMPGGIFIVHDHAASSKKEHFLLLLSPVSFCLCYRQTKAF